MRGKDSMNVSINNDDTQVILRFTPAKYILVYQKDCRFNNTDKVWTLCPRIDRSEKGKDDDIGIEILFLTDNEAEDFKKAGFSYTEL